MAVLIFATDRPTVGFSEKWGRSSIADTQSIQRQIGIRRPDVQALPIKNGPGASEPAGFVRALRKQVFGHRQAVTGAGPSLELAPLLAAQPRPAGNTLDSVYADAHPVGRRIPLPPLRTAGLPLARVGRPGPNLRRRRLPIRTVFRHLNPKRHRCAAEWGPRKGGCASDRRGHRDPSTIGGFRPVSFRPPGVDAGGCCSDLRPPGLGKPGKRPPGRSFPRARRPRRRRPRPGRTGRPTPR